MLAEWIAKEPSHSTSTSEFYFEPNTKSILYEDEQGPICVARYSTAIRVDMDFDLTADKSRIREAMTSEFPNISRDAKSQGFYELVFDSTSKPLVEFCRKLGFETSPDYRRIL